MIRVFLADDHEIVRTGLRRLLSDQPDITVCGEATHTDEVLSRSAIEQWDVLLLDINMPGTEGLDVVKEIARRPHAPAIVIFTMYREDSHAVAYLRAGARSFLSKQRSSTELLDAIRQVHQGDLYLTPPLQEFLFEHQIDVNQSPRELLSPREVQVVRALAQGKRGTDIARELHLTTSTVNTYVQRVKTKTGTRSLVELVQFAHDNDLL